MLSGGDIYLRLLVLCRAHCPHQLSRVGKSQPRGLLSVTGGNWGFANRLFLSFEARESGCFFGHSKAGTLALLHVEGSLMVAIS